MTNKHAIHKQFTTHYSLLTNFAVLDYSGTHSLNAHTNCISNFNIRNRLSALTSFARQSLASLLSQNNSLNCFVRQSQKSAFTLAETLIVMGIIGVVAALTLPNLNSSTGDREKVAKVKKIYQNLNDAFGRAEAIYGPLGTWVSNYNGDTATAKKYGERISEFMKVSKIWTNGNKFISTGMQSDEYQIILADGTAVAFSAPDSNDLFDIHIDIDGPNKGPNKLGKDIFHFCYLLLENDFMRDPLDYPLGYVNTTLGDCLEYGDYCSLWILDHDNMDYLKVDSNGKCPNGKILSESNPSCN